MLFCVQNNVDGVYFISGSVRELMHVGVTTGSFDFYEITIPVGTEKIFYYFELRVGSRVRAALFVFS